MRFWSLVCLTRCNLARRTAKESFNCECDLLKRVQARHLLWDSVWSVELSNMEGMKNAPKTVNGGGVVALNNNHREDKDLGCDCPHRTIEGDSSNYVDHYCGYKREYPHRWGIATTTRMSLSWTCYVWRCRILTEFALRTQLQYQWSSGGTMNIWCVVNSWSIQQVNTDCGVFVIVTG